MRKEDYGMIVTGFKFNFPPTVWAGEVDENVQVEKIDEELTELALAVRHHEDDGNRKMDVLMEAMDVICAVETLLRGYSEADLDAAHAAVCGRNHLRGYFKD